MSESLNILEDTFLKLPTNDSLLIALLTEWKKLNDYWRGYHKWRYHNDPEFRENILKKNDDWKRKNPEKFRQGRKIWYLKNREKLLKYFKKHYHEKRKKKSNGGVGYKHLNK